MSRVSTSNMLRLLLVALSIGMVLEGCRKAETEVAEVPAEVEGIAAPADSVATAPEELEAAPALAEPPPPAPAVVPEPPRRVSQPRATQPAPAAAPAPAPIAAEPVLEQGPAYSEPPPPPPPPRPVLVKVPTGTLLPVEVDTALSSHTSQVGDRFRAHLTQEIAAEGRVALPRGTSVDGRVTEASPAQKIGGRARLSLEFYSLQLPNGQKVPLHAVFAEVGKSQRGKDAAIIGGSTIGGAILGEAIDEGEGTKIGAVVGGIAGAVIAKKTKGKPVELPPGTVLTLELTQPVTVEVSP